MFGRVEKEHNNLIAATIAGPNPGVVDRLGYECEIDYRVVLTNGPAGVGTVGVYDTNNLWYNPACCVGTDEETGEDIKVGVLRVDCICACDIAGSDYARFVEQNTTHDNVTFALPFWGNCPADQTKYCDYYQLMSSDSYQATYNPYEGTLQSNNLCGTCSLVAGTNCNRIIINCACICHMGSGSVLCIQDYNGVRISSYENSICLNELDSINICTSRLCLGGALIACSCIEACYYICSKTGICTCNGISICAFPGCNPYQVYGIIPECVCCNGIVTYNAARKGFETCQMDFSSFTRIFNGTWAQWNALTTEQKKLYTNVSITNM